MDTKIFEIRDRATFIPVLATRIAGDDHPLIYAAGFGSPLVVLTSLATEGKSQWDPYSWGDRTYKTAHLYITEQDWATLETGDVIDVEFILGETKTRKTSQCSENTYVTAAQAEAYMVERRHAINILVADYLTLRRNNVPREVALVAMGEALDANPAARAEIDQLEKET